MLTLTYKYLAIDQYGNQVKIKKHIRKELLDHWGMQHAEKMYIDDNEGNTYHIGYIVNGHWYTILQVCQWEGKV